MYDWGKEQEKEIATIKERTIYLNLSDADCKRISTYAAKANITVSQLLESFIGDLVNGTYTNGSDERDCAQRWFERCGYGMYSEKTFLRYILEEGADVEFLLNGLEGIKKSKELIQTLTEELQKEIDRQRENPEYQYEWEEEDKECIQTEQEELDATIQSVKEWWEEYQEWKKQKNWWDVEEDTAERTFDEELIIIQKWWNTYQNFLGNEME